MINMFQLYVLICAITLQVNAKINIQDSPNRPFIADFEQLAQEYVQRIGKEYNRQVVWWDLHGRHSHLADRPQYDRYKISVTTDNLNYGPSTKTIDQPGYVYTQWYHNAQSEQPIKGQLTKEVERQCTFTWSVKQGLKVGLEIGVSGGIPGEFGASMSFSTEFSLERTESKTTSEIEKFSVSNTITVDPNTSVKAEWTIAERTMTIPWNATVYIDGYIAIWFKEKYDGHWLWFHPIYKLATGPFARQGNSLAFDANGEFVGVRGLESILKTYEYPLQTDGSRHESRPLRETIVEKRPALVNIHGD